MDIQTITQYLQEGADKFGVHFVGKVTPVVAEEDAFDVTVHSATAETPVAPEAPVDASQTV